MKGSLKQKAFLTFCGVSFFIVYIQLMKTGSNLGDTTSSGKELSFLKAELAKLSLRCFDSGVTKFKPDLPVIYAVTPTYARPVQKAELTRLSHTFMLVPNFHWIIVEDAAEKSNLVTNLLRRTKLPFTHLTAPTPHDWKPKGKDPKWTKPRGVLQRNTALKWIRDNLDVNKDTGVVYFADDDNSYSLELFEEMRFTHNVSVWPVGLAGGLMVERPIVNSTTGRVTAWNSYYKPERPFPIDMAGFAINLKLLLSKNKVEFAFNVANGYQETELLKQLIPSWNELEPKAHSCTKVYVWHTRTEAPKLPNEAKLHRLGKRSDEGIEI